MFSWDADLACVEQLAADLREVFTPPARGRTKPA